MARLARIIAVGVPHHVTQRGNARRFILQEESDRKVYLDLLRESTDFHGIAVGGYCLMTNHVHLIAIPAKGDVLARIEGDTRPVRFLLERSTPFDRACLAGAILFLSSG
jgi:putative transposase